jgi:GntR family transcriptional repressor for pyruvate dehydrogenase complex
MREAMSALEAMGFVASRHGSGTYVTSLSAEVLAGPLTFVLDLNHTALDNLFEVRVLLEIGAAQAAALAIDEATITALDQYLDAMRAAMDADELLDPDLAFHRVIHEASGNVVLLALMTSLRVLTRQSLIASADSADARRDAVVEHRTVLEGLRRRDPIAASTAMRVHLENARQRAAAAARSDASPPAKDRSP